MVIILPHITFNGQLWEVVLGCGFVAATHRGTWLGCQVGARWELRLLTSYWAEVSLADLGVSVGLEAWEED